MKIGTGIDIDEYETKRYFLHGKLHRVDGPAVESLDGIKYYYLNDEKYCYDSWLEQPEVLEFNRLNKLEMI